MPASASGVSTTRSSPKSFCSPSVIRKTPPSRPMSSPMSTTLASSSIARRRPRLSALPMVSVSVLMTRLRSRSAPRSLALPAMLARPSSSWRSSVTLPLEAGVVGDELLALAGQLGGLLGEDVVEDLGAGRVGHLQRALAQPRGELVALGVDRGEEVVVGDAGAGEVRLHPGDRVTQLPLLQLAG